MARVPSLSRAAKVRDTNHQLHRSMNTPHRCESGGLIAISPCARGFQRYSQLGTRGRRCFGIEPFRSACIPRRCNSNVTRLPSSFSCFLFIIHSFCNALLLRPTSRNRIHKVLLVSVIASALVFLCECSDESTSICIASCPPSHHHPLPSTAIRYLHPSRHHQHNARRATHATPPARLHTDCGGG